MSRPARALPPPLTSALLGSAEGTGIPEQRRRCRSRQAPTPRVASPRLLPICRCTSLEQAEEQAHTRTDGELLVAPVQVCNQPPPPDPTPAGDKPKSKSKSKSKPVHPHHRSGGRVAWPAAIIAAAPERQPISDSRFLTAPAEGGRQAEREGARSSPPLRPSPVAHVGVGRAPRASARRRSASPADTPAGESQLPGSHPKARPAAAPRSTPARAPRRGDPGGASSRMGSFKGHALPGTLFFVVGLWRVWSAVARYAASPRTFRVRAWNPVGGSGSTSPVRLLELYVVAGGAFADMCVEVLYSTHLRVFADGGVNPAHLNDLEHGGMLLMFFLFGALALASQLWPRHLPLTDGALCLAAAAAFTAELLLFYFHSTTHMGLEGYYHYLLVVLVALCVAATVLGALLPASFPVDLASGVLIALQGLWFWQTAFTLYGAALPAGCARDADGHVDCRARAAQERAEQLANFQLFGLVFLAFVYVLGCYAVAAAKYGQLELMEMHEKHVAAVEGHAGVGAQEEGAAAI
ncbi:hypothetical protein U9M48_001553 [Paspalum notatum var. saurae]|uniref:Uncharacterized protein n=1 Tax=Paspalum notatum var. saurae TaxID=547442 RepID=A0AAQ3SJ31_PASNO